MADEDAFGLLPGFVWAVTEAFAPAVAAYRFEQGDVIYRDRRGQGPLGTPLPDDLTAIQLLAPPRSARVVPSDFEGDRRQANWQSEVELELVDLARGRSESFATTQGRLFTALWKDDLSTLQGEGDDPPLPRSARELFALLREGVLAIGPVQGVRSGVRFLFVVDRSNDAARAKAVAIVDALHPLGPVEARDLDPIEAGAPDGDRFHPTLVIRELVLPDVEQEAVEAALRRALYGGSGEAERFSVGRHGLLERLGASEHA
ncbi:MAG: hypothetical protein R3F35_03620 [Myxococcota bacterium]